jgi:uncharacterized membrane protein
LITAGWLTISLIGFVDATYLTIQHYRGASLDCYVLRDCEEVTTSEYATIGLIPIALVGALYYLSIILLSAAYLDTKRNRLLTIISLLTTFGFLVSLILVYLQIFVIRALCSYCFLSALASTALFTLAMISVRTSRK